MPLPSDAARVSLLAESSEDESSEATEISAPPVSSDDPGRKANPLAHAPDAELDALVRSLRSKKPSDRTKLEAEEREAARARVRVELMSHVHRMKRGGVVAFPADFDADAAANAEAQRAVRRGPRAGEVNSKCELPVPFDPNLAARMRRELRETGTVSVGPAVEDHDADADADADESSDADADAGDLRDLDGSFERFRVSVDELANGPEPVTRMSAKREESSPRARELSEAFAKPSSTDGEDDVIADTFEQSFAKLAAMDDALVAIQKDFAAREKFRDVSIPDDDHDVDDGQVPPSTDTTPAREPFDEPFGGSDAEARLASVDARLKTFAARSET